jgi:hypothetical protein
MGSGGAMGFGGAPTSPLGNWATMREIVGVTCGGGGCHNDNTMPMMVDDATLYTTLTTYKATKCGNRLLVKPGAPQESAFYLAQAAMCGSTLARMPSGCVDNCTPDEYLEGIRQWIAAGAPK